MFAYSVAMHPPPFRVDQHLLDWPDCWLELRCRCGRVSNYPTKLMARRHGNRTFDRVLTAVRCGKCRALPASIHLCAGPHRTFGSGGPPPDWSIELRAPGR